MEVLFEDQNRVKLNPNAIFLPLFAQAALFTQIGLFTHLSVTRESFVNGLPREGE